MGTGPGTRDGTAREAELAALARVAEAVGAAQDLESFLARASREIVRACGATTVAYFLVDRERGRTELLHLHGGDRTARDILARAPLDGSSFGAAATNGKLVVRLTAELRAEARAAAERMHLTAVAALPVRFRANLIAVMALGYRADQSPDTCSPEALAALGAHVGAAIETHRLLDDLRGRVSELTLLNDIAAATAALDPVVLVENALRRVMTTFRADAASAYVAEQGSLVEVACLGLSEETRRRLARLPLDSGPAGEAASRRRVVHLPAVVGDGHQRWMQEHEGIHAAAAVPLLAKDRAVGVLMLGRRREDPFRETEVSLLSAIGIQLGVAVDNARLFADTKRRVADLEAVNALALRMFGTAPGDAQALLDAATREIARALSARSAVVLQLDATGTRLEGVSGFGTPLPPADVAIPLSRSDLARRALASQQPVRGLHVFDHASPAERVPPPLSLLLVPLTSRRTTRALVAIADVPERQFNDAEVALASALATEAAMGLENAELHAEERRRVEELSVINEVARVVAGSLDLGRILAEGARAVRSLVSATSCNVLLLEGDDLRWSSSTLDSDSDLIDYRIPLAGRSLAAQVIRERRPIAVEDALTSEIVDTDLARHRHIRSLLAAPLLVRDHAVGVLEVSQHDRLRLFTAAELERVMAVANQLAVAIDNARLYEDLRRSYAELAQAQGQLVHQERLAALGQLAAVVAHEVRNPLGVIFNSLGSLRRLVQPRGDALMLFDMAQEEADRLNRIVGDLLDFARPTTPTLHPEPLDHVIDDAVAAALADHRQPISVERRTTPGLPLVPMDGHLLRQAILNVAMNAIQAMPEGGTLTVRSAVEGKEAVVEISDTGPGVPEELRQRVFEPFFTTKATGTGLGLAVVKRIVEGHRGRIELRTREGGGATFAIHLPLEAAGAGLRVEMRRRLDRL